MGALNVSQMCLKVFEMKFLEKYSFKLRLRNKKKNKYIRYENNKNIFEIVD